MITFITVNFNGASTTLDLLRSFERQTDTDFCVIVVDNASQPEDRGQIGEFIPTSALAAEFLTSSRNLGFSGGNNLGIRKALAQAAQWIVLVNNDTTVPPDFVERLKRQLGNTPSIVGIPLREGARTAYAGIVKWLRPTLPHVCEYSELQGPRSKFMYAIGAGVAVHRDVFARVGLLDERYFLYFEDADFSVRARRSGVPVRFLREPVILHRLSASASRLGSPLLLRYHARNALLFNGLHGPWWVRTSLPVAAFYGIVRQLVKMLFVPAWRPESRAIAAGIVDFYAKRFGHIAPDNGRHRMRSA